MKTAADDFTKTKWSWFRRHLNLTLGLVWFIGLIIILLLVNLLPAQDSLVIGIVGIVWGVSVYVTAGWVLHYKQRSLAWLLLLGIGVLLALVLENKYDSKRFTFHNTEPDEYRQKH